MIAVSLKRIIYNGQVMPYESKGALWKAQKNEIALLLLEYHLLCFTNMVADVHGRNALGWSLNVVTVLYLAYSFAGTIRSILSGMLE